MIKAKETEVVEFAKPEVPTISQLNIYSETALRVEIKGIQFIIGTEIQTLQIIKNNEVIEDHFEADIYDIADLERYAIKWYYANELGRYGVLGRREDEIF